MNGHGAPKGVSIVIPVARCASACALLRSIRIDGDGDFTIIKEILLVGRADVVGGITVPHELMAITRLVPFGGAGASAKRNYGCRKATEHWVLFLDDDVVVANNFQTSLKRAVAGCATDVVQGVAVAPVSNASWLANLEAIHYARTVRRDWSSDRDGQIDPRMCLMRLAIAAAFPFCEELPYGGEGHELLRRLRDGGIICRRFAMLRGYHQHRVTLSGFVKQRWRYGCGRAAMFRLLKDPAERRRLLALYLSRQFGWTYALWRDGRCGLAEFAYGLCGYVVFWAGFVRARSWDAFGGLRVRDDVGQSH